MINQMTLRILNFSSVLDTSTNDIVEEFFVPALRASVRYDRGVGYFSSGWLRTVSAGLIDFAEIGGRIRLIASPILNESDWKAIRIGDQARRDEVLHTAIERNIRDLGDTLENDTLSALAWMVADKILTIRLAQPVNKLDGGEFHTKFGIFTDVEGNQVSFEGSNNETVRGTLSNYEKFKVFCSWNPAFLNLVQSDVDIFERLWCGEDPNVNVFELPEAIRLELVKLRSSERPYPRPSWIHDAQGLLETEIAYRIPHPQIPATIQLRDYQEQAIDAWFAADCQGLLEMATGTGKTITALAASARLFEQTGRLAIIIAVPYQHLVDQWAEEAKGFGYRPILAYRSKARWLDELNHQILDFNGGYRTVISVIVTHDTFISSDFQGTLARLKDSSLIIADEVHHLGAEQSRTSYPQHVKCRLALSATPNRWFDDLGTQVLREYFGETVFEFALDKAIGLCLTPYYYYPHLVELTDTEMAVYEDLSTKIARLLGRDNKEGQEAQKILLIRRASLLNKAENKLKALADLIDNEDHIQHTLFYCAPGQIDDVIQLLGREKRLWVHRFTAEEDAVERQDLLVRFATGELQGLVAMKCLDEGVDVPSTRKAYFLASTSNPREFIQRRGRILRMAPGKEHSVVHDLIAVPPDLVGSNSSSFNAERSIMRRELRRFKEFANLALNKHNAIDVIWELARHYSLIDF